MKLVLKAVGGFLATGTVVGFTTAMIIVNKSDEVQVPNPNHMNHNPPGWRQGPKDHQLRMANWNLENLTSLNHAKSDAAAAIINDADVSIVAVEEVDYLSALYSIAYQLNFMQGKKNAWKVVASPLSYKASGDPTVERMSGISAQEYYGFLYDSSFLTPTEDTTGAIGKIYNNPFKENQYLKDAKDNHGVTTITNVKSAYVRPPFATTFEYNEDNISKDFTAVMAHLDSPRASSHLHAGEAGIKNSSAKTGDTFEYKPKSLSNDLLSTNYGTDIGSQEVWEAEELPQVMSYFDGLNGTDSDMIFMGDTNIKNTVPHKNPFQNMIDAGYQEKFDPTDEGSKTSLGNHNNYSNPYDRFYSNSPLTAGKDPERYDFGTIFSRMVVNKGDLRITTPTPGLNDAKKISDHTLVVQTLDMNKSENGHSTLTKKIQDQKEIDINKASYFDLTTKLGLNDKTVFKILYYRKYVGQINNENELTNILKYFDTSDKTWKGNAHFIELNENAKFVYTSTPTAGASTEIMDQSSYITHTSTHTFAKIDVNAGDIDELSDAQDKGLLDASTLNKIMQLRNSLTPIKSVDQLGIAQDNPSRALYSAIYDFSKAPTHIDNPFDVNIASFDTMSDKLVGYNSPYRLYPYHIAAIIAYREQVGKIDDKAELESIIGSYGASKIGDLADYSHTPVASQNADLQNKISIYDATSAQLDKYIGGGQATRIMENIINEAKKDVPAGSQGNTVVPVTLTKDIIFDGISHLSYFEDQFDIIFSIPPTGNVTINIPVPNTSTTYSISDLITHAKLGKADLTAFLKGFPNMTGSGSSGIGAMSSTQFEHLVAGIAKLDPATNPTTQNMMDAIYAEHSYSAHTKAKYDIIKTNLQ